MFFIMGVYPVEKKLDFRRTSVCPCCGRYGCYEVFIKYMCFSLFFIPIIRWNKRYYVKMTCCQSCCEIENELGRRIEKGEVSELNQHDLHFTARCDVPRQCGFCGFKTDQDFQYCPKCGRPF